MRIAILGFDREGQSSYDYFLTQGHEITICDQNTTIVVPTGCASVLGKSYLDNLDQFDMLVRTAGLPTTRILAKNPLVADRITTQTNEFFKICPSQHIIGITGTKGKSTTSTLVHKILQTASVPSVLGGNIGIPPLKLLPDCTPETWAVLELSSHQLSDFNYAPQIGICLMMAPEHLSWHDTMENYVAAKANLFARQTADQLAIYYANDDLSRTIASHGNAQKLPYYAKPGAIVDGTNITIAEQSICRVSDLQLLGEHNIQNVCAAITIAWQITQDIAAIRSAIKEFKGLEYRLEYRGQKHAIRYYNDSFASAPPAPLAALQAISGPKILILGGFDRGLPLDELAAGIAKRQDEIKKIVLIGQTARKLADALRKHSVTNYSLSEAETMSAIVNEAASYASSGDAVILSPGFASFDMFKDFVERGELFNAAVAAL
jgi:UDP-N-acetylmuramoylalanine--D-glutamate ligase